MWFPLALSLSAQAATPVAGELHVAGGVMTQQGETSGLGGGGIGFTLPVVPRVAATVDLDVLVGPGGDGVPSGEAGVGWYLVTPWDGRPAPWISAGMGMRGADDAAPFVDVGVALDLPLEERPGLRLRARAFTSAGGGPSGALLTFGPAWPIRKPAPAPVVVAQAPKARELTFNPPTAMVWLPHPQCTWVTPKEAMALSTVLPAQTPAEVVAPRYRPALTTLQALPTLELRPAPEQGGLLVVARPGDRVTVDGHPVPLSSQGVAVLNAPPGGVDVEVVGGGRTDTLRVGIADGHASWVRATTPDLHVVRFPVGGSSLDEASRADLQAMARAIGGWRFEVRGYASPEGDRDANLALARDRADAVMQALLQAGMPQSQVSIREIEVLTAGSDYAAMRRVEIVPTPLGATP